MSMDPHPSFHPARPVDAGTDDLPMFAAVEAPDIRHEAPSAPGSETSRRAAERIIDSPLRRKSWRAILLTLGSISSDGVLSREALSDRLGIPQHILCARLSELRPTWVEVVPGACRSSAGVNVDGYRITDAGRRKLVEAA